VNSNLIPARIRVRATAVAGSHLYRCFISLEKRQEGWRMMQRAKRIARRLNVDLNLMEVA